MYSAKNEKVFTNLTCANVTVSVVLTRCQKLSTTSNQTCFSYFD